jgi:hypothetical protein
LLARVEPDPAKADPSAGAIPDREADRRRSAGESVTRAGGDGAPALFPTFAGHCGRAGSDPDRREDITMQTTQLQIAPRRRGCTPGSDGASAAVPYRPEHLRQLVQLRLDDEQILAELRRLNDQIEATCLHLSAPGEDATLGLVLLGNLRLRYCDALTRLQSNRLEARWLQDAGGPRRRGASPTQ